MENRLLSPPEVRLQLAAITLAEELNFTRAADRLKITQPALSKQIADLEDRIGFAVFKRNQKRVELTDAGQVFIRGCRDAFTILEKAVRLARATHNEVQRLLTIGHSPYVNPALISAILSTHLPLYPDLRLRMESMFALDLAHSVLAAELDLAIIAEPSESPHLTLVQLASVPLCVAMQADHPAAKRRSVSIEEFGDVGWMIFPRKAHPATLLAHLGLGLRDLHDRTVAHLGLDSFDHIDHLVQSIFRHTTQETGFAEHRFFHQRVARADSDAMSA